MKSVVQNADGTRTVVALEDGNLITGMVQDCNAIAESAKAMHNAGFKGPSGEMRLAARIPLVVIEKYCHDQGITYEEYSRDPKHAKRVITDPANSMFRVWSGAI